MPRLKSLITILIVSLTNLCFFSQAEAQSEHTLLRRISVFPMKTNELDSKTKDEVWWRVREVLATNQRFLVATRRFMVNRDVFQPRATLEPADSIILGKILDAQAVMTLFLTERTLNMHVYDGSQGYTIWKGALMLHPALSLGEQIVQASEKLTRDFITSFPYQGSQKGERTISSDDQVIANIYVGAGSRVVEGEPVQWISLELAPGEMLFSETPRFTVIAEGVVIKVSGEYVEVAVTQVRNETDIRSDALIRFPKELERLQSAAQGLERQSENIQRASLKPVDARPGEQSSTTTSLAWLLGLATFVLLAF